MSRWGIVAALCASLAAAPARALDDPDLETARRHFESGAQSYADRDYRRALDEFVAAARVHPGPAIEYNIARCYDRLEDYRSAAEHYRVYLRSAPRDRAEIAQRLAELDARVAREDEGRASVKRTSRRKRIAIALGVVAGALLVGAAIALGVAFGSPAPDYTASTLGPMRVTP